ncbi:TonB-dependent receptor plug domain-containing protein [Opitutales bacterium]|nr:TonB-dependent receptor plug domain-containing protein [Opitutales bacterium]
MTLCVTSGKVYTESNSSNGLTPFEKADLRRLLELDVSNLSQIPIKGVLGYEQEYWRNPASVHVIRPEDITLNGYLNSVEALRGVPGMHVSRGLAYDNFASMRNFSGFSTQKFLGKIGGREVSQLMLGSANYSVDDYPVAVIDRIEVIRGPGASIWGTNAVNGVLNLVTKHSANTQGNSVRLAIQDNGTFLGDYVHGGKLSDDSYYRFWVRDQEYAEGTLDSGLPARDDGYLRKAGFRFDKNLGSDLNLYIAGGFATRRVEHVLDLSNRLLHDPSKFVSDVRNLPAHPGFSLLSASNQQVVNNLVAILPSVVPPIPLSVSQQLGGVLALSPDLAALNAGLNAFLQPSLTYDLPSASSYPAAAWGANSNGTVNYPALNSISLLSGMNAGRIERYGEMTNDSAHIVSKVDGITDFDMEWSLTGSLDHTDIYMGHLGYEWEQTQYNLSFDANFPLADRHRISYGVATQHTDLDVKSEILDIFQFPGETLRPILDYDQSFTKFNRFTGYIQDSISSTDTILISVGAKVEENDLAGFGFQPGVRASWMANEQNIFWAGYAKTHRQPSLRERYTDLTPLWTWNSTTSKWESKTYEGDSSLDREEMDAYELGWRLRPSEDLLFELSTYYYDTQNAVRGATSLTSVNAYEAKDAKAFGGELSIDYRVSDLWRIRGGYSFARGEVEGARVYDFPENTASLSSHFKYSDEVTLIQNLFYSGKTEIPSDYNPITIPSHLRLDLGVVWQTKGDWEIGLFGRDLLESYHVETMYPGVDVEPARVERTFMLTLLKKF